MVGYSGMREGIDDASMLTRVMITNCLLKTPKNYYNTLKVLKTVLKLQKKTCGALRTCLCPAISCLARASSSRTFAVCRPEPRAFTQLSKDIVFRVPPS